MYMIFKVGRQDEFNQEEVLFRLCRRMIIDQRIHSKFVLPNQALPEPFSGSNVFL
jgi:hypothetical protein